MAAPIMVITKPSAAPTAIGESFGHKYSCKLGRAAEGLSLMFRPRSFNDMPRTALKYRPNLATIQEYRTRWEILSAYFILSFRPKSSFGPNGPGAASLEQEDFP
ncbi:MAG: hypothetical protein I8H96_15415 [Sphingomonadaceae bacterium]|nr:hypothetical protein [Sphingomonadaceae bacterium]